MKFTGVYIFCCHGNIISLLAAPSRIEKLDFLDEKELLTQLLQHYCFSCGYSDAMKIGESAEHVLHQETMAARAPSSDRSPQVWPAFGLE